MGSKRDFEIPFEGLKLGKHQFNFKIRDKFFEELSYSIIQKVNVDVLFTLDKKETMMVGVFEISGTVSKPCDRCNDLVEVPISVLHQVVYKLGDDTINDDDLIVLPRTAFFIDISSLMYELITLAVPNKTVHENREECNQEMMKLIDKYVKSSEEEKDITDPRWDVLKNLN